MEKKQGITIIAGNETYENLTTFKTVDELNKTVRAYKEEFVDQLNKTQLAVLNKLHNYSSKFFGVSFRTKKHIAEDLNISRRTVIRVCLHLESLGIIKQLEMKRKSDMRQTSNAIVIQPIVEEHVVTQAPVKNEEKCHTNKTTTKTLKQNIKDINKRNSNEHSNTPEKNIEQADFVAHWVPERFVSLVSSFYSESKTIQELWKVVRQCNKIVNHTTGDKAFTKDQELTIGLKAIKEFVMKIKSGTKMKKGKFAYFNGIVNKLMDKFYFDKEFMAI
ncbi:MULTISPECIES: helix-turn-helix domain-containing protein [Bacillus cereus group]|uniref:DeoR family transcriptional regulator n=1 Tax=Bacillus thuringiensis subsp. tolworthi TaxID=1442 RepID=A0A9W4AF60_BACTO|nr:MULTISPECIES: helix-turn-helix domain-containing protein [Bacillus cereus group]MEB8713040.1 helix-turn-helix domain-containing protein [Bacillus cereus]MEB9431331.1 helix-turn-helix domain-containing protein [Bacillus cereus]MEB9477279.1 helix-turn-helix domain-containing protein [Bacillus cereus]MEB9594357.1 helix-turn-helix domain-containing protein [Bacillus cereus]MRB00563.1 helix-turn-helix domain-containing protein [Bacillus thuringiensis]